jgi:hypothetical protein
MDKQFSQGRKGNSKDAEREEERMKYRVGDKVRVRKDLIHGMDINLGVSEEMEEQAGKTVTIEKVYDGFYRIEEESYCWTDEMLEPATLSTGDMINALMANPKQRCKCVGGPKIAEGKAVSLMPCKDGMRNPDELYWSSGEAFVFNKATLGYQWTLIPPEPQPIPFLDAVKAYAEGKTVECEHKEFGKRSYTRQNKICQHFKDDCDQSVTAQEILEGKWTIKE